MRVEQSGNRRVRSSQAFFDGGGWTFWWRVSGESAKTDMAADAIVRTEEATGNLIAIVVVEEVTGAAVTVGIAKTPEELGTLSHKIADVPLHLRRSAENQRRI